MQNSEKKINWIEREIHAECIRKAWKDKVGHTTRANEFRDLLLELVKLFQPHTYVEIGVAGGYTFNALSPWVGRAVAVDIKPMPEVHQHENVETYIMPSENFAEVWDKAGGDTIDLLFIDADHSARAVFSDVLNLAPFVRPGFGLICLHDTHPNNTTRYRQKTGYAWFAAWKLRQDHAHEFEVFTLPGPDCGLTLIRKSRTQLAWRERND